MADMNDNPFALLQQWAGNDPALGAVIQVLERARASREAIPETAPAPDERLPKLESLVRRMHHDLKAAEDRLSLLAAALGACGLCWGEDVACLCCRGRGRPGMIAPDPQLRQRLFAAATPSDAPSAADFPTP